MACPAVGHARMAPVAGPLHSTEAAQPLCVHHRARLRVVPGPLRDLAPAAVPIKLSLSSTCGTIGRGVLFSEPRQRLPSGFPPPRKASSNCTVPCDRQCWRASAWPA